MNERRTALDALLACRRDGAWIDGALKAAIARDGLNSRDAALASELAYGVVQNRALLDFYLAQLLTGKIKDLQPILRDILHIGLYQLYFLDKIPDSAAVNEAVELAKTYGKKQRNSPALVNGVLRAAIRSRGTLCEPKGWAEKYSHPQELIDRLIADYGREKVLPMLIADNCAPKTVVQVNTLKISTPALLAVLDGEGIAAEAHPWMPDCLILGGTGSLEQRESFRRGLYYVQDCAARLSVLCAGLEPGMQVLDCCAAPGGKSFAAAIAMRDSGGILSCDIYENKVRALTAAAQRLGLASVDARVQDASAENPAFLGRMDAVLCDVPCSGYGIIRKKPDIRYKKLAQTEGLPALQLAILRQQAKYLKPGGVLIYSTCTLLKRENEAVVEAFLQDNPRFSLEKLPLPAAFPADSGGMLTLMNGEMDTDGFFISRMRRNA